MSLTFRINCSSFKYPILNHGKSVINFFKWLFKLEKKLKNYSNYRKFQLSYFIFDFLRWSHQKICTQKIINEILKHNLSSYDECKVCSAFEKHKDKPLYLPRSQLPCLPNNCVWGKKTLLFALAFPIFDLAHMQVILSDFRYR